MLGDALRVGPQIYPAAARGTPVVQRGPHGEFLAPAMPIRTYQGTVGMPQLQFQWWWANRLQPGLTQDMQKVTGVMGMGEIASQTRVPNANTIVSKTLTVSAFLPEASRVGHSAIGALNSALAQAQRQNQSRYDKDLAAAVLKTHEVLGLAGRLVGNPSRFSAVMDLFGELNAGVAHAAKVGQQTFARTPAEQAKFEQGIRAAEKAHKQYVDYSDVAPDTATIVLQAAKKTSDDLVGMVDFPAWLRAWVEENWYWVALGVVGSAAAVSFAYGAGQGAFQGAGRQATLRILT